MQEQITSHIRPARLKLLKSIEGYAEFIAKTETAHNLEEIRSRDFFGREVINPSATGKYNTKRIRAGDKIIVRPDDMSWHLELVVTHTDATLNHCVTREINFCSFEAEHEYPPGWRGEHLGPNDLWGVFYNDELRDKGLPTPDSAVMRARALHSQAGGSLDESKPKAKPRATKPKAKAPETEDA